MFTFDLQRHGGKGSTTVQAASVPDATPQEQHLQDNEARYSDATLPNAMNLQNMGMQGILNNNISPSPDYSSLYQQGQQGINSASNSLNAIPQNINNANSQYQTQMNGINSGMANNQSQYDTQMAGIQNGIMPEAYAQNRQAALNADLQGTMGNAVSGLGNRGMLNSSVTGSAMNQIGQNASNTLANNYASDLNQVSGMANQTYNNNLAGYQAQGNNYNQGYTNTMQGLSSQSQLANQQLQMAQAPTQFASNAQQSALQAPEQYFSMATGQNAPTANMWQTESNQRYSMASPEQTVVQGGNGGLLGGLATGLGAYAAKKF